MRVLKTALLVLLLGMTAVVTAAQEPRRNTCTPATGWNDSVMAVRYAPIFRFSMGERYFPTLPFFPAFDGVDNDTNGLVDFNDPREVLPLKKNALSWERLDTLYLARTRQVDSAELPGQSAVFYQIRTLKPGQERELRRFLRSDEQAWKRFRRLDQEEVWETLHFKVIEYYLYYVKDEGLEGHPEDIEFVFIFVPYVEGAGQITSWDRCFRIVVGGGHTYRTPNNVLVFGAGNFSRKSTPSILVELGGHSSAPDYPPDGRFFPGLDVNWHIYNVWGTRDIQAISGVGFDGPYGLSMTFPRDTVDAVVIYPGSLEKVADSLEQQRLAVKQSTDTVSAARDSSPSYTYDLVPAVLYDSLDHALRGSRPNLGRARELLRAITGYLKNWNPKNVESITDSQLLLLKRWDAPLHWESKRESHVTAVEHGKSVVLRPHHDPALRSASKHQVFEHEVYDGSPTWILKGHLFRPTAGEFAGHLDQLHRLLTFGFSWQPDDAYQAHLGVIIPALDLPTRIPGFLELQVGSYGPHLLSGDQALSLAGLFEHSYSDRFSWYAKLDFVNNRAGIVGDPAVENFSLGGGLSILTTLGRHRTFIGNIVNSLRIRAGVRTYPGTPSNLFNRVGLDFQITFRQ